MVEWRRSAATDGASTRAQRMARPTSARFLAVRTATPLRSAAHPWAGPARLAPSRQGVLTWIALVASAEHVQASFGRGGWGLGRPLGARGRGWGGSGRRRRRLGLSLDGREHCLGWAWAECCSGAFPAGCSRASWATRRTPGRAGVESSRAHAPGHLGHSLRLQRQIPAPEDERGIGHVRADKALPEFFERHGLALAPVRRLDRVHSGCSAGRADRREDSEACRLRTQSRARSHPSIWGGRVDAVHSDSEHPPPAKVAEQGEGRPVEVEVPLSRFPTCVGWLPRRRGPPGPRRPRGRPETARR